jgi:FkbM family methyltransferase
MATGIRAGLRKVKRWLGGAPRSAVTHDATIAAAYRRLLEREPNFDELAHWNVFLSNGTSLQQLESSLRASYDYAQLGNRADVVLVALDAFKIYCRSSDLDVGAHLIVSQGYEPHVTKAVQGILKSGDVFLDLGANIGYYTLLGAQLVGEAGRVIAFKPNAINLALLYASIVENALTNVRVYPLAASDSAKLLRMQAFGSNGFLAPAESVQSGAQYVQAVVVDDLLIAESRIDVVKMDIEGYEPFAVRGMGRLLEKHRPVVLTEFSPWHIEHRSGLAPRAYLDLLAAKGYVFTVLRPSGEQVAAGSPERVMESWRALGSDKVHLDLLANPA